MMFINFIMLLLLYILIKLMKYRLISVFWLKNKYKILKI